MRVDQLTY